MSDTETAAPQGAPFQFFSIAGSEFALPEEAERRLELLTDEAEAARDAYNRASDNWQEAIRDEQKAKADLQLARESTRGQRFPVEVDGNTVTIPWEETKGAAVKRQKVERETANVKKHHAKVQAVQETAEAIRRAKSRAEDYLRSRPQLTAAKVNPGSETIEKLRDKIAGLDADLHEANSANYTRSEIKATMRAEIEALAEAGRVDVMGTVAYLGELRWPRTRLTTVDGGAPSTSMVFGTDARAVLAWLHKDALLARLEAEIDEQTDDAAALSAADRARRMRDLRAEKLKAEQAEAALMFADGRRDFREDMDPRAILGVEGPATTE